MSDSHDDDRVCSRISPVLTLKNNTRHEGRESFVSSTTLHTQRGYRVRLAFIVLFAIRREIFFLEIFLWHSELQPPLATQSSFVNQPSIPQNTKSTFTTLQPSKKQTITNSRTPHVKIERLYGVFHPSTPLSTTL